MCQLYGDLLVTMFSANHSQSKVVRYSGYTEKQSIQFNKGKPLYAGNDEIKYITEKKTTAYVLLIALLVQLW